MEAKESQKKSIKLHQDLIDLTYEQFNTLKKQKNMGISKLEKILEIYDIEPNLNYFYLEKCFEYCYNETNKISTDKIRFEKKINFSRIFCRKISFICKYIIIKSKNKKEQ